MWITSIHSIRQQIGVCMVKLESFCFVAIKCTVNQKGTDVDQKLRIVVWYSNSICFLSNYSLCFLLNFRELCMNSKRSTLTCQFRLVSSADYSISCIQLRSVTPNSSVFISIHFALPTVTTNYMSFYNTLNCILNSKYRLVWADCDTEQSHRMVLIQQQIM